MKENQKNNSRLGWTVEEQQMLKNLYEYEHIKSWIEIAKRINRTYDISSRSSKQCRERYNNFVKLKSQQENLCEWTHEENQKLFDLFIQKGSKWVQIARSINGRSQNSLKNRFYGALRKSLNLINRLSVQFNKKLKPIKYLTLSKILDRKDNIRRQAKDETQRQKNQFCEKLRLDIILIAKMKNQITADFAKDIIERAHKFNILTRFQNMARNRSFKTNKKPIYKLKTLRSTSNTYQQDKFDIEMEENQKLQEQDQEREQNKEFQDKFQHGQKPEKIQQQYQQVEKQKEKQKNKQTGPKQN